MTQESMKVMEPWKELVLQARQKLQDAGYPMPSKPSTTIDELQVPPDVEKMGSAPLANLLLRFQGWYAYSTAQLAFARSDLAAFIEFYEVSLGNKMHSIAMDEDSRQVKDVLKALALKEEPMASLMVEKIKLEQRSQMIDGFVQSLAIQCKALTNEQIRRHAAQKIEGGRGEF